MFNYPSWEPMQPNLTWSMISKHCKCMNQAVIRGNLDISLFTLLVLSFNFPFAFRPTFPNWQHKLQTFPPHAVSESPPKYQRKPFSHIYSHDKLPCKCLCGVQEESGFTAAQAGSSAGIIYSWLGGRALLESHQWFFCLLRVWNRSRQVPSISFPPCTALYEPHLAD